MTDKLTTDSTIYNSDESHLIRIDPQHLGIRVLVPLTTILLIVVVHFIGSTALSGAVEGMSAGCLMLPVDLAILGFGGHFIEQMLKRWMPSRRSASLTDKALTIRDERTNPPGETTINWLQTVNVKAWRFEVPKRARVQKGWYCLAVYLLQDEDEIVLYTFMSPAEAEHVIGFNQFTRLRPRKETEANTDLNAVAEQRRLLKLEDIRWNDGAEIERDDFRAVLAVMQRRVPGWY